MLYFADAGTPDIGEPHRHRKVVGDAVCIRQSRIQDRAEAVHVLDSGLVRGEKRGITEIVERRVV